MLVESQLETEFTKQELSTHNEETDDSEGLTGTMHIHEEKLKVLGVDRPTDSHSDGSKSVNSDVSITGNESVALTTSSSSYRSFSDAENWLLEKLFTKKIQDGENLTSESVHKILKLKTPKLLSEYGEKKLLAKVRWLKYKFRNSKKRV